MSHLQSLLIQTMMNGYYKVPVESQYENVDKNLKHVRIQWS